MEKEKFLSLFSFINEDMDQYFNEPMSIRYTNDDGKSEIRLMNKEASSFIYNKLMIGAQLSKNLYGVNKDIWRSLINFRSDEKSFDITSFKYIVYGGVIISVCEDDVDPNYILNEAANVIFNNYKFEYNINNYGVIRGIISDGSIGERNEMPALFVTMNMNSGAYFVHEGYKSESGDYIIYPRPSIESYNFCDFMSQLSGIEVIFDGCQRVVTEDKSYPCVDEKLSVREVMDIFKSTKADVGLDENGFSSYIDGINAKDSDMLVSFFNSFKMPFKSLKKMKYIKKYFKYDHLTVGDMLGFLSRELMNTRLNITPSLLGYFVANVMNDDLDKKLVINEVSNSDIFGNE